MLSSIARSSAPPPARLGATRACRGLEPPGLAAPARFGSEVVARLLGLRYNHPSNRDGLEPLPGNPATRAEAAYLLRETPGAQLLDGALGQHVRR